MKKINKDLDQIDKLIEKYQLEISRLEQEKKSKLYNDTQNFKKEVQICVLYSVITDLQELD